MFNSLFGPIRLTLGTTALLCACAFGAAPATSTPAGTAPAQPALVVEPIDPGAILLRADIDERFARGIIARAREPGPTDQVERQATREICR